MEQWKVLGLRRFLKTVDVSVYVSEGIRKERKVENLSKCTQNLLLTHSGISRLSTPYLIKTYYVLQPETTIKQNWTKLEI